jgi:hypothetical protein
MIQNYFESLDTISFITKSSLSMLEKYPILIDHTQFSYQ